MSIRKKTYTRHQMVIQLLEMDSQIIDGSDIKQAAEMISPVCRPKIVCLCGSTRFWKIFQEQSLRLATGGIIVLSIGMATASDTEQKLAFDELHKRKIDLCDEVLVLNVDGYIGESTRSEIEYALENGKPVNYLHQ